MTNGTTDSRALADLATLPPLAAQLRRRSRTRLALAVCVVVSVMAGAVWKLETTRVRTVAEGRVYQSGVLSPARLREEAARLGLRAVIDLRIPQDEVRPEKELLSRLGVRHIHIPSQQVPDDATVKRFLEEMNDPANYPVLVHCYHGTGRSVLFSAIYRIEYEGWDREQARLATRSSLRRLIPGSSFDPAGPKGSYLLRYVSRLRRPGDSLARGRE